MITRTVVALREAGDADAEVLVAVWAGVLRRGEPGQQVEDVRQVIADAVADPDSRLVVAEFDGRVAGAVYLRAATVSPINLEPVVLALSPHVLPEHRRHGVGRALMDAAVSWAEERGIGHMATATASGARDANRFMARLAMAPQAVLRVATTSAIRSKVTPPGRGNRQLTQVLAARRSQRQRGNDGRCAGPAVPTQSR